MSPVLNKIGCINDINDVLIITPKLEQEIKWIEVNEFNNIDDWLVESNRNEYLQSLHSIKNSKLNIEKFLSFLEDAALNIKYWNKSKWKPAKSRRQRNRRYRETSTPDNESFKFDWENSDFFKSLRKHSWLSKKCLKTWRYLLEQSKNNSDKEMIEHYLDITKRFEKLRKIFDDYAIIETLNNKNKNDISRKIDLHGLRKREALIVLKAILKEIELDESRMGKSKEYIVITGKGKHSKNGPVLKPAIESYLKDMKIPYKELNHNGGFILNLTNYSKSRISD